MNYRWITVWFCVSLATLLIGSGAVAQQIIYKWVDEEGVVHFSESPPEGVDAERVVTSAAPTVAPLQNVADETPSGQEAQSERTTESAPKSAPAEVPTPISEMSLAELDARCEAAREELIAPLREAEIARCQAQPRSDPEACVRMNADFGAPVRTINGTLTPRMFHDIPPCLEAHNERIRRPR